MRAFPPPCPGRRGSPPDASRASLAGPRLLSQRHRGVRARRGGAEGRAHRARCGGGGGGRVQAEDAQGGSQGAVAARAWPSASRSRRKHLLFSITHVLSMRGIDARPRGFVTHDRPRAAPLAALQGHCDGQDHAPQAGEAAHQREEGAEQARARDRAPKRGAVARMLRAGMAVLSLVFM